MKCEWCHKRDAETQVEGEGEDEVKYVCNRCAKRLRREAERSEEEPFHEEEDAPELDPEDMNDPMQGALDALDGMIDSIRKTLGDEPEEYEEIDDEEGQGRMVYRRLRFGRGKNRYRYCGLLHLEGLFLVGELDHAKRIASEYGVRLTSVKHTGMLDAGHAFAVSHRCSTSEARDMVNTLIERERMARKMLREELTRLYMDTTMRSLAILRAAKLMAPDELFDLISPLKLAAYDGILAGIDTDELEELAEGCDMRSYKKMKDEERNSTDAVRADEMNERFRRVTLNWDGEQR